MQKNKSSVLTGNTVALCRQWAHYSGAWVSDVRTVVVRQRIVDIRKSSQFGIPKDNFFVCVGDAGRVLRSGALDSGALTFAISRARVRYKF
jgi:hypothetical protein